MLNSLAKLVAGAVLTLALVVGMSRPASATITPTDYSTTVDNAFTLLNFSGTDTSFLATMDGKVKPIMVAVLIAVVVAGVAWRLGGKTKRITG